MRNFFNQPHTPTPVSSPPSTSNITTTPDSPLPWLWTCHSCHTSYPLGATRRCLDDGHTFCAGVSSVKRRGRNGVRKERRRSRACGSEFDYSGWKAWSRWRKARDSSGNVASGEPTSFNREMEVDTAMQMGDQVLPRRCHREGEEECSSSQTRPADKETEGRKKKDCWEACNYPSHCRWGKAVGIHTPSPSTATFSFNSFPNTPDTQMSDMPTLDECFESSQSSATGEECINPKLLGASSNLILPPERDNEGCTEESGAMAVDTLPTASSSSSSPAVHDYTVEQGASASLRELSLSPPLSSMYPAWEKDGRDKGNGKEKEKKSRYLRRCARVTGMRVRTALF